jgi:transposase
MKEEEKWEIVHLYKSKTLSLRKIAKKMKCTHPTVLQIISNYKNFGVVSPPKHSGRPSIMNDNTLKSLDRLIDKNDTATSQVLANLLQQKTGKRISARTIRRARTGPLGRHPVHEKITKSLGEGEKQRRVSFAQKLLTMNLHYILWSDEKLWQLDSTGQVHWIKRGDQIPSREVKVIKASVMVWGCVWYSGKSELCVCEENIDAGEYIKILTNYLLPCMPDSNRYKFQQDNARPHIAKKTKTWLAAFAVSVLEDWPANSPDMNPIEHVWSWMRVYVNKEAPTDKKSLIKAIEAAWDEIPQSVIRSYIGHLNNVCQQIIAAGGDHI